ncbi:MAG: hypothetical protein ABJF50_11895 [Paracoccaceae bacterium]
MKSVSVDRFASYGVAVVMAFAALPAFASDRVSPDTLEFPTETAALIAVTTAFFQAAENAATAPPVPNRTTIGLPQIVSPARVEASDPAFEMMTNHGAVQHLTGYRINWYPVSRLLGTVDFMGTWGKNRNLVCGYVSWDLSAPEAPMLENLDVTYVDLAELKSEKPHRVHAILLEANCAFGAVDANFAFFEPVH